jgi:hypothetical protein
MVTSCCKRVSDGVSMRSMITTMSTDLHIEFCKSKASADRWCEEVELLREEMAQTKQFFQFHSSEWSALASSQPHGTPGDKAEVEGRRAYDLEQAAQFDCMHDCYVSLWEGI